ALVGLVSLALVALFLGCRRSQEPKVPSQPALRLYVASTLAGAIEPCGCRKDMLGGVDHAAAIMAQGRQEAPNQLFLGAGPMLFMEPEMSAERQAQDLWKAESLAAAFKQVGLVAWAPGVNDFIAGTSELRRLVQASGAQILGGNLSPDAGASSLPGSRMVTVDGIRVGIAGVSLPKHKGFLPKGLKASPLAPALAESLKGLREQG